MVDLQAIRFRFENEEAELAKFVEFLKTSYPDEFKSFKGKSFESVFSKLRESMALHKVFPHPDDPIITPPPGDSNNNNNKNNNNRNCTCNTPIINSRHAERRQLLSNNDHVTLHSAFKSDRTADSLAAAQRTTTTPTVRIPSGLREKKNNFHQINNTNTSNSSSNNHSNSSSINSHTVHNKKHKKHHSIDTTNRYTNSSNSHNINKKNYKNNYNDTTSSRSRESSSSNSSLSSSNSSNSEISSISPSENSSSSISSNSSSNSSVDESRTNEPDVTTEVPRRVFKRDQSQGKYVARGAHNRTVNKDLSQLSSRVNSGLPHISGYDSSKARLELEESRLHSGNNTEPPLFVLHINNIKESFYLFGHYVGKENDSRNYRKEAQYYEDEYERVHHISQGIHIGSIVILFIMVVETFIKLCCMRVKFFKKKFEVFDAFIVMASFALDFVFLDSQWYETGKDASTILVLLLPWRVVRIVNSFLMTVNRKHHIEIMTVRKSKKKADMKIIKLQALINEITRDVELLVALSRSRGAPEHEITACLYGKGRRGVAMSAISSFASLMLISTLGKSNVAGDTDDDLYGHALEEAMKEDQDDNDDTANGILMEEDEEDDDDDDDDDEEEEDVDDDDDIDDDDNDLESGRRSSGSSAMDENLNCRRAIRMARSKMAAAAAAAADVAGQSCTASTSYARRNTIPQPALATTTRNSMLYYINNGYALHEPDDSEMERRPSLPSTNSVHSLPGLPTSDTFLSFDVATQMTYL